MPAGLRRYYGKGDLHFITFRCYRRLPLLRSARARNAFVSELAKLRDELQFRLIGYVVMPEHVHLLISEPRQGTPSTMLQKLKLRVAVLSPPAIDDARLNARIVLRGAKKVRM